MKGKKPQGVHIGILSWVEDDGVTIHAEANLCRQGYRVSRFQSDAPLPAGLDLIMAFGPSGSLVPTIRQILDLSPTRRPRLLISHTEQFPSPVFPEPVVRRLGKIRANLEWQGYPKKSGSNGNVLETRSIWSKAVRFRYYGDLFLLKNLGIPTTLIIHSKLTARKLSAKGFDVLTPPLMGLNPQWGRDLGLERDIPVLWLGKPGSTRRLRLLKRVRGELRHLGVEMMVVDGVEHPYVFGEDRTVLANRTKIMLNLLRKRWDDNSLRYWIASANGALIVSEPTLQHTDFIPGEHLVEVPVARMAEIICYYLQNDLERNRIVQRAVKLITTRQVDPDQWSRSVIDHALSKS